MSYALTLRRAPAESVERVRREQLEAAAEALDAGEDPVEAIHDARKRIKKTRALLRLAARAEAKAYRRRNRALRDTGPGDVRHARRRRDGRDRRRPRRALRRARPETFFARARRRSRPRGAARGRRSARHAGAARARARRRGRCSGLDADALAASLQAHLRRAAARPSRAPTRKPTRTNLHEWRKRVKDLWYQQQLLEDSLARRDEGAGQGGQEAVEAARRGS